MTKIFSGNEFVEPKYKTLEREVEIQNLKPKMVSILVGNDPASLLYTRLKQKAAQKIGGELIIKKIDKNVVFNDLVDEIEDLNNDSSIHGIMIQMPVPGDLINKSSDLASLIDQSKDVDGLRINSKFDHPTALAVFNILKQSNISKNKKANILIVGSHGMVGKSVIKLLTKNGYFPIGIDRDNDKLEEHTLIADVIISATGQAGLIDKSMVLDGVVCIDVGSPKGDFAKEVEDKASFFTPVPGGVGPVTIYYLMQNLVTAATP